MAVALIWYTGIPFVLCYKLDMILVRPESGIYLYQRTALPHSIVFEYQCEKDQAVILALLCQQWGDLLHTYPGLVCASNMLFSASLVQI